MIAADDDLRGLTAGRPHQADGGPEPAEVEKTSKLKFHRMRQAATCAYGYRSLLSAAGRQGRQT